MEGLEKFTAEALVKEQYKNAQLVELLKLSRSGTEYYMGTNTDHYIRTKLIELGIYDG